MDPESIRSARKMDKLESRRRASESRRILPVCDFADDDDDTMELEEKSSEGIPQVFLITSVSTAEKKDLKTKISHLGGSVIEVASESVTCCIAGSLMRNEKVLISLASGIPILPMDYIHESAEQGNWLDNKTYELKQASFLPEKSRNEESVHTDYKLQQNTVFENKFEPSKARKVTETMTVFRAMERWQSHYQRSSRVCWFSHFTTNCYY